MHTPRTICLLAAILWAAPTWAQGTKSRMASLGTTVEYTVATRGNEARYRVRERLATFELPSDAVGVTSAIAGSIFVDTAAGTLVPDKSRIVVTLTNLKSDQSRRDTFLRRRTMEIDKFPTVTLAPKELQRLIGAPWRGSASTFDMLADLTVRGVTKRTVWKVTARDEGRDIVGSAKTAFTFKDFELDQPRVPIVLTVSDTIQLEYDFRFTSKN